MKRAIYIGQSVISTQHPGAYLGYGMTGSWEPFKGGTNCVFFKSDEYDWQWAVCVEDLYFPKD